MARISEFAHDDHREPFCPTLDQNELNNAYPTPCDPTTNAGEGSQFSQPTMYTRCSADDTHVAPLVVFTSVLHLGPQRSTFFPNLTAAPVYPNRGRPPARVRFTFRHGLERRGFWGKSTKAAFRRRYCCCGDVETPTRERECGPSTENTRAGASSQAGRDLTFPSAILEQRIASPKLPLPTTLSTRYRSISQRHPVSLVPARCSSGIGSHQPGQTINGQITQQPPFSPAGYSPFIWRRSYFYTEAYPPRCVSLPDCDPLAAALP